MLKGPSVHEHDQDAGCAEAYNPCGQNIRLKRGEAVRRAYLLRCGEAVKIVIGVGLLANDNCAHDSNGAV